MEVLPENYPLKCSICNKPLSVAPIYHNDSTGNVCGRCTQRGILEKNDDSLLERQIIVEEIAKYLLFPCSFKDFGCTAELKWGSVKEHEEICTFNLVVCPLAHHYFKRKCSWNDTADHLAEHVKENHANLISSEPSMKVNKKLENRIIVCELTERDFEPESCSSFLCQIEITSDELPTPIIYQHKGIQPFGENCLDKPERGFEVNLKHLKHLLVDSKELTLTFSVTKDAISREPDFSQHLLQELECPVCFEHIRPPIFICEAGHNICGGCKVKVVNCPICRGNLLGGRNFTLESLTTKIKYPCKNKFLGCSFLSMSTEVEEHENYCQYIEIKCFIETCQWKGLRYDLKKHLTDQHSNLLIQLDTVHSYDLNNKNAQYIFVHDEDLLLLKLSFEMSQPLKFAILRVGPHQTSLSYNFKIIGCSSFGMSVAFSGTCKNVSVADLQNVGNVEFSSVPFEFLSQFLLNFSQVEFLLSLDYGDGLAIR